MKRYTILWCALLVISASVVIGCHEDTVNKLLPQLIVYQGSGQVAFKDSKEGLYSDKLVLNMTGATPPPAGFEYEGWLISDGTAGKKAKQTSFGRFSVDAQGRSKYEWTSFDRENLIDSYNKVSISIVQMGKASSSSDRVVYQASLPISSLTHIRHVCTEWAQTLDKSGFLVSATKQAKDGIKHAGFAATATSINGVKSHADHVYAYINGKLTGEIPGNANVADNKDPGGYGIIRYMSDGSKHAGFAASTAEATQSIKLHASHINMMSENTIGADGKGGRAKTAADKALEIVTKDYFGELKEAQADAKELQRLCELILMGEDLNKDGSIVPPKEGGITTSYEHAQFMAGQTLSPTL